MTARQERVIKRWADNPVCARLDAAPQEDGSVVCSMFGSTDSLDPPMLLIGVGRVYVDGIFEMHTPTEHEIATIKPMPDDEGRSMTTPYRDFQDSEERRELNEARRDASEDERLDAQTAARREALEETRRSAVDAVREYMRDDPGRCSPSCRVGCPCGGGSEDTATGAPDAAQEIVDLVLSIVGAR